jgi:hypothetical protein
MLSRVGLPSALVLVPLQLAAIFCAVAFLPPFVVSLFSRIPRQSPSATVRWQPVAAPVRPGRWRPQTDEALQAELERDAAAADAAVNSGRLLVEPVDMRAVADRWSDARSRRDARDVAAAAPVRVLTLADRLGDPLLPQRRQAREEQIDELGFDAVVRPIGP